MIKPASFFILFLLAFTFRLSAQDKALEESIIRGEDIYSGYCASCHMAEGQGIPGVFPPLAAADFLNDRQASIAAIKYGIEGPITVNGAQYNSIMAPISLNDEEIADVLNFIYANWGNTGNQVTPTEVAQVDK